MFGFAFKLFQINLYEIDDDGKLNDKIIATGYYKVTKPLLENSLIDIELSLLSSNQIIGSLKSKFIFYYCKLFITYFYLIRYFIFVSWDIIDH